MKKVKSILLITITLTVGILVLSSFSFANEVVAVKASVSNFNNAITTPVQPTNNELNDDVWFAFTTIAVLGTYLAFKK